MRKVYDYKTKKVTVYPVNESAVKLPFCLYIDEYAGGDAERLIVDDKFYNTEEEAEADLFTAMAAYLKEFEDLEPEDVEYLEHEDGTVEFICDNCPKKWVVGVTTNEIDSVPEENEISVDEEDDINEDVESVDETYDDKVNNALSAFLHELTPVDILDILSLNLDTDSRCKLVNAFYEACVDTDPKDPFLRRFEVDSNGNCIISLDIQAEDDVDDQDNLEESKSETPSQSVNENESEETFEAYFNDVISKIHYLGFKVAPYGYEDVKDLIKLGYDSHEDAFKCARGIVEYNENDHEILTRLNESVAMRFSKYRSMFESLNEGDDEEENTDTDDETSSEENTDENKEGDEEDAEKKDDEEEETEDMKAVVLTVKKEDAEKLKKQLINAGCDEDDIEIIEGEEDDDNSKVRVDVNSVMELKDYLDGKGIDLEEEIGGEIVTDDEEDTEGEGKGDEEKKDDEEGSEEIGDEEEFDFNDLGDIFGAEDDEEEEK